MANWSRLRVGGSDVKMPSAIRFITTKEDGESQNEFLTPNCPFFFFTIQTCYHR